MDCEIRKCCPIYERHGSGLCLKLFRIDKCPPEIKIKSRDGDQILLLAIEARLEIPVLPGEKKCNVAGNNIIAGNEALQ